MFDSIRQCNYDYEFAKDLLQMHSQTLMIMRTYDFGIGIALVNLQHIEMMEILLLDELLIIKQQCSFLPEQRNLGIFSEGK